MNELEGVPEVEAALPVAGLQCLAVTGEEAGHDGVGRPVASTQIVLKAGLAVKRSAAAETAPWTALVIVGLSDWSCASSLVGEDGVQVDVVVEGLSELVGRVLLHGGVVSHRSHGVHVAVDVGDLRSHPDADDHQRRGDEIAVARSAIETGKRQ